MSSLIEHAEHELDLIGLTKNSTDEVNKWMRHDIMEMTKTFSDQGHSGTSASYALSILQKILNYKPLTPLTGEDDEWDRIPDEMNIDSSSDLYQNKRYSSVFKRNGKAYDSNAIVFYEYVTRENGEQDKIYYTNEDSSVDIEFPYTPSHQYIEIVNDELPI